MALKAVDDRLVALHDTHDVAGRLVPAEKFAVVRAGHDVLPVAAKIKSRS